MEKYNQIAYITINHPPANTFNLVTTEQFASTLDEVERDHSVRVIVLTGAGKKFFSAGFDVTDAANADKISPMARALWTRIDRFTKPVVAAINGHVMGGGLELALCCHFKIMVDDPSFKLGLTELNLGIIPGWGGTQRLARLVGRARALNMILFSKSVNPREALEMGLIDKIVPPERLMDEANELVLKFDSWVAMLKVSPSNFDRLQDIFLYFVQSVVPLKCTKALDNPSTLAL